MAELLIIYTGILLVQQENDGEIIFGSSFKIWGKKKAGNSARILPFMVPVPFVKGG